MEWIQFIQEASTWLEPLPLDIRGEVADICDRKTWHAALILHCCFLSELSDAPNLRSPNQAKQWIISIAKLDVGELGKQLKTIANAIRHYASSWSVFDISSFKDYCSCSFAGLILSPVKDYLEAFLSLPTAETLKVLLQWTCFLTRITLETGFDQDPSDFLESEIRLKELKIVKDWDDLREVILPIVQDYHPSQFSPSFSNGANSDSPRALGVYGKVKYGWVVNSHQRFLLNQYGWDVHDCPEEPSLNCKLVFVPKGIDSKRAICEEPAFNMFLQQGILKNIDKWFLHNSMIRRYINLHDQSIQRERARKASITLSQATLDLHAASDSVSWVLVRHVLEGTPLYEDLLLTRTESVLLPTGEVIKLNKFAPMGSALCFPIECLIFLGICLLGCRNIGVKPDVGVYGDDLIVPVEAEDEIIRLLTLFGFIVNDKKSFFGYERFKESCGGEYFDGIDVSPLYIPRNFSCFVDHRPQLLETYTDLANSLFSRDYKLMRRALLTTLVLPNFPGVLFSRSPEKGIQSLQPTNFHLRCRWNSELQRLEWRSQYLKDTGDVVADDEVRYFLTMIRYRDTRRSSCLYPEDAICVKLTLPRTELAYHWVPTEDSMRGDAFVPVDGSVTMFTRT